MYYTPNIMSMQVVGVHRFERKNWADRGFAEQTMRWQELERAHYMCYWLHLQETEQHHQSLRQSVDSFSSR